MNPVVPLDGVLAPVMNRAGGGHGLNAA